VPIAPIMPLFATETGLVASNPPPMCIECDHPNLSAFFGRLAVHPERADTKQGDYESALTLGQAVRAIEVCYAGVSLSITSQDIWDRPLTLPPLQLPKLHLRMLRSFVERTIRHARLVIAAAESRDAGDDPSGHKKLLTVLDHSVRMLRREVVRAIRHKKLELRWPTGETSRPNKSTLRGTKSGLTSFVNRVCYAVTRELGCFALPLLPLAPRSHASDMKVDSLWNPMSLGIWWDDGLGWIVQLTREVESSEVSTEIGEEQWAGDWDHSEEEGEGEGARNGENCNENIEEDMYENGSIREGSISDESMGEESE